ncbi:MAG: STAS domain-containing protein [Methylococcaceae bacterium]|nr:STAS domain-containing protein [Methylococcaceae bacterium]
MNDAAIEKTDNGFSINGEMSFATVHRLLEASSSLNFSRKPVIEIDLGRVSRADSAGLALMVEWMAQAKRGNTDIRFRNMPKQMREIAGTTEVDKILPLGE